MKKIVTLLIIQTSCIVLFAQDPQFSQFYAAPIFLGPSMAGVAEQPRIFANYRDQWPKLAGRYVTYALSFDNYFDRYRSGVSLMLMHDRAGGKKMVTTMAGLNYSYRIIAARNFFIQPGLSIQYSKRNINYSSLKFADQYIGNTEMPTTVENLPANPKGHADFSSSVLVFGEKYWLGVSFDHLMKLNRSLVDNNRYLPLKASVYGGYKIILKEELLNELEKSFSLAFQFRDQAHMEQLDMGIYYKQHPFMVGFWYRGVPIIQNTQTRDAITLLGGLEFDKITFSYSYDFTISSLITYTGGANEIALIYKFEKNKFSRKKHYGAVPCPKF